MKNDKINKWKTRFLKAFMEKSIFNGLQLESDCDVSKNTSLLHFVFGIWIIFPMIVLRCELIQRVPAHFSTDGKKMHGKGKVKSFL